MSFADSLKSRIESLEDRIAAAERDVANMRIGIAEMCGERAAFLAAIRTFEETQAESGPAPRLNIREAVFDYVHDHGPSTFDDICKGIGRYPNQVRPNLDAHAKDGKLELVEDRWQLPAPLHFPRSAQAQAAS